MIWRRLLLLGLCELTLLLGRHYTRPEPLHGDLTQYAVIGHELLSGRALYGDLVDHSPPARYWTYAWAERMAGYGSQTLWLLGAFGASLLLLGFYFAGSAWTESASGGLVSA